MPTYDVLSSFWRDWDDLSPQRQRVCRAAVDKFVADLAGGGQFRKGLRVKGVQGARGIFEMTWADDGRLTFQFGDEVIKGEPHVIWRRVGTHDIFDEPRDPPGENVIGGKRSPT
jgi:hypothetical protein